MDPKTVNLVVFIEQMASLAAKTALELKGLIDGSSGRTVDDILADADSTYKGIIDGARGR